VPDFIQKAQRTIQGFCNNRGAAYFFKRWYFRWKYDADLLEILEYAALSGRKALIDGLQFCLDEPHCNKRTFLKALLEAFNQQLKREIAAHQGNPLEIDPACKKIKNGINRYLRKHATPFLLAEIGFATYTLQDPRSEPLALALVLDILAHKQKEVIKKRIYFVLSMAIALIVAAGEAMIVLFFTGSIGPLGLLLVAAPAFFVSYYLYRLDVYHLLKSVVSGALFKDKRDKDKGGQSFSLGKKILFGFVFALSIFSGLSFGLLQVNSILTTFGVLFWGLTAASAIAAPPVGLIILAVSMALVSAVATTALFYMNFVNFVRERKYQQYIDLFKHIFGKNKNQPISIFSVVKTAFDLLFLGIGLAAAAFIYVFSLGVYHSQAFNALHVFLKFSEKNTQILCHLFVHAGQLLNGFFYMRHIMDAAIGARDFLWHFPARILRFFDWMFDRVFDAGARGKQPSRRYEGQALAIRVFSWLPLGVLGVCCCINGRAQGLGVMRDERSMRWVSFLPRPVAEWLATTVMATGSTQANYSAVDAQISMPEAPRARQSHRGR
jgi:hypothetical protein